MKISIIIPNFNGEKLLRQNLTSVLKITSWDCPSWIKEDVLKDEKTLFIDKGDCKALSYVRVLKTIYREDRSPVFQIVEVDENLAAE